jgi:hypothetical protein
LNLEAELKKGFQYRVPGSGKNQEFPVSFPVFIPGFRIRVPGFETVYLYIQNA